MLHSLKNLGIMFVISLVASTLYFLLTPLETDNPTELLARTNPSIYDVIANATSGDNCEIKPNKYEKVS